MLERVKRHNEVGCLLRCRGKLTNVLDTRESSLPAGGFEQILSYVDASNITSSVLGDFHCFRAVATTEIDDRFASKTLQELFAEKNRELRFSRVGGARTRPGFARRDRFQNSVL